MEAGRAALVTQQARLAQVLAGPAPESLRQAEEQVAQAQAAVQFSREQMRRRARDFGSVMADVRTVLTGVIVNNAILLVHFMLAKRREEGLSIEDSAVEGATARLRPVLMTTLTTAMGLLPVAIGFGEGAELQAPLARAVVGGLVLGTMVTLVVIPTLYVATETYLARRRAAVREEPVGRPAPVAGGENGHS